MGHHHSKVLIIGSGPAGYTAAIYAARANLKPIIVAGMQPGGQMTITTDVENYPGFEEVIQGPWLMEQMQKQAEAVGTQMIHDMITNVDFTKDKFQMTGDMGDTYSGDTVIIATGAQARCLGLESEERFQGFGVSACATCDGFFFKDQNVAVVGGGNTAVEEALYLTNHAAKVTIIHRRDTFRAEKILQDRLLQHEKIEVIWDSVIAEILGGGDPLQVTGARIENVKTKQKTDIDLQGVFVAIGHDPATGVFKGKIDMDDEGYILTKPDSTVTSIPVFSLRVTLRTKPIARQ